MPALVGGYELLTRLAVGGMAEVFLARRPGPDGSDFEKRVALKRILPHLSRQADFVGMFLDEARMLSRLEHPHIVHVHDFGKDGDSYFLAMEYVCGEDLAALVRRAGELGMRLPFSVVATILRAAADALHHAHEQGIVHRDVTPANLMVSYDGVVKLADFGIAKSHKAVSRSRTQTGTLKGKIPYMSPEQARGRAIDRASDIFSLGVVGWELLAGQRLFDRGDDLKTLRAVQKCDARPLAAARPHVPAALATAIETALAPAPHDRWATAAELSRALEAWFVSTGEVPSTSALADTMTRLYGADAAERRVAAATSITEPTSVGEVVVAPAREPHRRWLPFALGASRADDARGFIGFHPERWLPEIAIHLHLPPPRLPRFGIIGPALALLLSGGGLVYGLHSPHARRALSAAPIATTASAFAGAPAAPPPSSRERGPRTRISRQVRSRRSR